MKLGWNDVSDAEMFLAKTLKSTRTSKASKTLQAETKRIIYRMMNMLRRSKNRKLPIINYWTDFIANNPAEFDKLATAAIVYILKAAKLASIVVMLSNQYNISAIPGKNVSATFGMLSKLYPNTRVSNLSVTANQARTKFSMILNYSLISQYSNRIIKFGTSGMIEMENNQHPDYDVDAEVSSFADAVKHGMYATPGSTEYSQQDMAMFAELLGTAPIEEIDLTDIAEELPGDEFGDINEIDFDFEGV